MKSLRVILLCPLLFIASSISLHAIPDIKPVSFDHGEMYSRIVAMPATIPPECRGEEEVTSYQLIAFEGRLANSLEGSYGPITNPDILASLAELDERAHGLAFRFALEKAVMISEREIQETYEEFRERFRVTGRAHMDFFFVEQKREGEDSPPEILQHLRELGVEGASVAELKRIAEKEEEVIFSERAIRIEPTTVAERVWEVVVSTEPGTFSPVSRTNHGWHLFLVHDVREPGIRPLEEVEPAIRGQLVQERALSIRDALRREWIGSEEVDEEFDFFPHERMYIRELYGERVDEIEALRKVMVNNAKILAYENVIRENLEIPDSMRREEFDENREVYLTPVIEDVIEVRIASPANQEQEDAITDWYDQVRSGAHSFPGGSLLEELGLGHQIIDHGPNRRGPRGARLDMTVQQMEVNTLSDPVEGNGYYRYFFLRNREDRRPMTFEEAREDIDRRLRGAILQNRIAELSCLAWEEVRRK